MSEEPKSSLDERLRAISGLLQKDRATAIKTLLEETGETLTDTQFGTVIGLANWTHRPEKERRQLVNRALGHAMASRIDFDPPAQQYDGELYLNDGGGVWETCNSWLRGASEPVQLQAPRLRRSLRLCRAVEEDGQWTMDPTVKMIYRQLGRVGEPSDANSLTIGVCGSVFSEQRTGPCSCLDPAATPYSEDRVVGVDEANGRRATVEIRRCRLCSRHWLHYRLSNPVSAASRRWFRGVVSAQVAARLEAQEAVAVLEALPHYIVAGPYFGRAAYRSGRLPLDR